VRTDIIVLGVNGMLGNTLFQYFKDKTNLNIKGILRKKNSLPLSFKYSKSEDLIECDVLLEGNLKSLIQYLKPNFIINCIGIVKKHSDSNNPLASIKVNSLFPHLLSNICEENNSKLIHISTDCVFSGKSGFYTEKDQTDPIDLYGRTKLLGEVLNGEDLTLRTSCIGEELITRRNLLSWFLSQSETVDGFSNAIFSGLPTIEIARIILKLIIPNPSLKGIYHLSSNPIDKYSLLNLIKKVYKKNILIKKNIEYCVDRSLDSTKFRKATGYEPLSWNELVEIMYQFGNFS
tara:strand:+ start:446 stop:1315 length:870 start_codon:yes stop_codon:yes gene_type:complete